MEGFRADIDMSNDMPPPYSGERIDSFSSMSQASQAHSDSISFWHEQANQDHLMSQVPMDGFDQHQYGNIPALTPQAPLLSTYGQNPFSNSTSSLDAGCAVTGGAMALPFRLRDQASFGPQMAMQTSYGGFHPQSIPVVNAPDYNFGGLSEHHTDPSTANGQANYGAASNAKVPIQREDKSRKDSRTSSDSPDPTQDAGGMTAEQSGPMSKAIKIPPRAKPGRKPIDQEHAQDRRRVQNRMAQRAFRDKRQQRMVQAISDLDLAKEEFKHQTNEFHRQIDQLKQTNAALQGQLRDAQFEAKKQRQRAEEAEARAQIAERQNAVYQERTRKNFHQGTVTGALTGSIGGFRAVQSASQANEAVNDVDAGPSPPASDFETDFTNYGRTTQAPSTFGPRVTTSNESNEMDFTFEPSDDKCGFCTDEQNCACRQEKVVERVIEAPIVVRSVTLPGSCDMCRADPVRAQACRDMARSTNMSAQTPVSTPTSETPRTSLFDSRHSLTAMMPPPRMSCSSMVDAFNKFGERTSSIASLFGGKALTAYPAATGGYEFEETQAAEVLSTLSRRSTMASSPEPDDSRR